MANHAYVIVKKLPPAKKVDAELRDIVSKFPQFTLTFYPKERSWFFHLTSDEALGMSFWLSKTFEKEPCIEFRHGHCANFFWWIEYEIREELARRYGAVVVDDGDGERNPPQVERYLTFSDYEKKTSTRGFTAVKAKQLNLSLSELREWLPSELHPLIGNDVEIPEQQLRLYQISHKNNPPIFVYSTLVKPEDIRIYFRCNKSLKESVKLGEIKEVLSIEEIQDLNVKTYATDEMIDVENPETDDFNVGSKGKPNIIKIPKIYKLDPNLPLVEFYAKSKGDRSEICGEVQGEE
jgi:hypothetical protein